jgi:hypothetical protein
VKRSAAYLGWPCESSITNGMTRRRRKKVMAFGSVRTFMVFLWDQHLNSFAGKNI